ncbi:MAG TPA: hypothetical protein VGK73_32295 [Polyangiaceae bacterium]
MDPNANLQEQERIIVSRRGEVVHVDPAESARLAELRAGLVSWLAGGGFEPAWYQAPRASAYFAARGLVKLNTARKG